MNPQLLASPLARLVTSSGLTIPMSGFEASMLTTNFVDPQGFVYLTKNDDLIGVTLDGRETFRRTAVEGTLALWAEAVASVQAEARKNVS